MVAPGPELAKRPHPHVMRRSLSSVPGSGTLSVTARPAPGPSGPAAGSRAAAAPPGLLPQPEDLELAQGVAALASSLLSCRDCPGRRSRSYLLPGWLTLRSPPLGEGSTSSHPIPWGGAASGGKSPRKQHLGGISVGVGPMSAT